jgi:ketosteroid isomerase-like protein
MQTFMRFVAIVLVVAAPLRAQETSIDVVKRFHDLQAAGDSLGALALMTPDVVIFESGGVEASREEYRSHHLGADVQFASSVTREIVEQRSAVMGDHVMVLTETRAAGTFRDREINRRVVETMVLRRTSRGWRIVHIHWSSRRLTD